ncbi:hypothetical protein [Sporosarcina sp. P34]|uniref:hypothetical protein n=1 Tax=Sporosarcina sp. P34 TaxID=2048247 RepID=UPI00117C88D0|nr:hypothetical protein [Sporosarcina sp. P34]
MIDRINRGYERLRTVIERLIRVIEPLHKNYERLHEFYERPERPERPKRLPTSNIQTQKTPAPPQTANAGVSLSYQSISTEL